MSNNFFEDPRGNLWWSDIDAIDILLRRWAQLKAYAESMKIIETGAVDNFHTVRELSFDAARFQNRRQSYHQREMGTVSQNLYSNPETVVRQLIEKYNDIPRLEAQKARIVREVMSHNNQMLNRLQTRLQNTVTGLQTTRNLSAAIFMCCIPGAGLSVEAAILTSLSGSIFSGIGTYQDTGNIAAAGATQNLEFISSLFALIPVVGVVGAGVSAGSKFIFAISSAMRTGATNTAIRTMTVEPGTSSTFTTVLREELISAGLGAATSQLTSAIGERIEGELIPVFVDVGMNTAFGAGTGVLNERISNALEPSASAQNSGGASTNTEVRGRIAVARLQSEINQRSQQQQEAAWQSIPFNRFLATGDRNQLNSPAQQYVSGNLLRRNSA
ncbi:MAG: hypothetical protein R2681_03465 [Pyrinomonadaceae bacterium]